MILKNNNQDEKFYAKMGKFFADRSIIKELDCQLYNDNNMIWYLSINEEIEGFISVQDRGEYNYIDNFYIIPKYRNKGIGKILLNKVMLDNTKKIRLITRNEIALKMYQNLGFKIYSQNGRYFKLEYNKQCFK